MTENRLELTANVSDMVLSLWRIEDNGALLKLNSPDGELVATVKSPADVQEFLKQSYLFIKEMGV